LGEGLGWRIEPVSPARAGRRAVAGGCPAGGGGGRWIGSMGMGNGNGQRWQVARVWWRRAASIGLAPRGRSRWVIGGMRAVVPRGVIRPL
jgi:hypothetical protein